MDLLIRPFLYVVSLLVRIRNFFFEFFEVVVVLGTGLVRYLRCHYFEEQLKKHMPQRRTKRERRKAMYQEVYNMAEGKEDEVDKIARGILEKSKKKQADKSMLPFEVQRSDREEKKFIKERKLGIAQTLFKRDTKRYHRVDASDSDSDGGYSTVVKWESKGYNNQPSR